ncbi:hypothetical protein O1W71_16305 [Microbacterium sp. H37-C3]|uniref:hypothetical protein n=1 Tax=Microbacterium sp. H37-C3 TaxID=3004354 RepID=UPI0022AF3212|nr:hypothetical protein [Microbacterium sp. H37-C3]MCZ4069233.1 hypothetical protein [Microbacterium sp. H37-C3]
MTNPYTPTTGDVERQYRALAQTRRLGVTYTTALRERRAEFQRWLAAHDAQVRAEALLDVAREIESNYPADLFPPASSEQLEALHEFAAEIGLPDGSRFHVGGIRHAMALLRSEGDYVNLNWPRGVALIWPRALSPGQYPEVAAFARRERGL